MTTARCKNTWYADGLRFECTRCGECCSGAPGYVWVSPDECARIATELRLTVEQFTSRHTRRVGTRLSLLEKPDGDCEFLIREASGLTGCAIHRSRPIQCRTWPFWKSNLKSPRAWAATAKECPGIDQGPSHPLPVIQQALRATDGLPL